MTCNVRFKKDFQFIVKNPTDICGKQLEFFVEEGKMTVELCSTPQI